MFENHLDDYLRTKNLRKLIPHLLDAKPAHACVSCGSYVNPDDHIKCPACHGMVHHHPACFAHVADQTICRPCSEGIDPLEDRTRNALIDLSFDLDRILTSIAAETDGARLESYAAIVLPIALRAGRLQGAIASRLAQIGYCKECE